MWPWSALLQGRRDGAMGVRREPDALLGPRGSLSDGTIKAWEGAPLCALQGYVEKDKIYYVLASANASLPPIELGRRVADALRDENVATVNGPLNSLRYDAVVCRAIQSQPGMGFIEFLEAGTA